MALVKIKMLKKRLFTLEFESVCSEGVDKSWATDLSSQVKVAFEKFTSSINTMNNNFDSLTAL